MAWSDATNAVDKLTTSLHDVAVGIVDDVAAAGNGADVHLDLDALRAYYESVSELWHQINSLANGLDAAAPSTQSSIGGVSAALTASAEASSGTASLRSAAFLLRSQVGEHLSALKGNYVNYVSRESENVTRLSKAAGTEKPLGW